MNDLGLGERCFSRNSDSRPLTFYTVTSSSSGYYEIRGLGILLFRRL